MTCPKCSECDLGVEGKPGCDSPPEEWWQMEMDRLDSLGAFEPCREPVTNPTAERREWLHDYGSYRRH
jgi:hypothetical protein